MSRFPVLTLNYARNADAGKRRRVLICVGMAALFLLPYARSRGLFYWTIHKSKSGESLVAGGRCALEFSHYRTVPAPPESRFRYGVPGKPESEWRGYVPVVDHDDWLNPDDTKPGPFSSRPLLQHSYYTVSVPWYVFCLPFLLLAAWFYWRRPRAVTTTTDSSAVHEDAKSRGADDDERRDAPQ